MPDEIIVRVMTRGEIELALEWAASEGWNPGLHDAESFHALDPNGFFLGLKHGKPVGCIAAVAYDDQFGFIGLYIVKPEYRAKGYGIQLFRAGMSYLAQRNMGLDAVLAQQKNYEKSGFKSVYRNVRYAGTGGGDSATPDVADLTIFPFEEVSAYDRKVFPAPRARFLDHWLEPPMGAALGIRDREQRLAGYGVVRSCRNGCRIGPLFADTPAGADQLFHALRRHVPESASLFFDAPDANKEAIALAQRHGFTKMFETARMYTRARPAIAIDKVFGVTTLELG
jgi:ribosomal protein S18 acetylase RimI-like enzyme